MSQEKVIKCDKCGRKMTARTWDQFSSYSGILHEQQRNSPKIEIDLCWTCSQLLIEWLNTE